MVSAVAREESNGGVIVLEDLDGCAGVAPWREGVYFCDRGEAWEFVEAGTADDGDVDGSYESNCQDVT